MKASALPSMHEFCLLQVRSDRTLKAAIASRLESQNLTVMEWLALGAVAAGPRKGLSMTEIAAVLDVTLPQVTALAGTLTENKLITQTVLPSDHRSRQVTITLKGKRVLVKLESAVNGAVRGLMTEVQDGELQAYVQTLERLSKADF